MWTWPPSASRRSGSAAKKVTGGDNFVFLPIGGGLGVGCTAVPTARPAGWPFCRWSSRRRARPGRPRGRNLGEYLPALQQGLADLLPLPQPRLALSALGDDAVLLGGLARGLAPARERVRE